MRWCAAHISRDVGIDELLTPDGCIRVKALSYRTMIATAGLTHTVLAFVFTPFSRVNVWKNCRAAGGGTVWHRCNLRTASFPSRLHQCAQTLGPLRRRGGPNSQADPQHHTSIRLGLPAACCLLVPVEDHPLKPMETKKEQMPWRYAQASA